MTKYDYVSGFVRKMPGLNGKGRSHHGCGQFINNENQQASKNKITKFFDYFCFQWVNIKLLTQTKYRITLITSKTYWQPYTGVS